MKIAIIGFGFWGEILLKSILSLKKDFEYFCVFDKNLIQKGKAKSYKTDFYNDLNKTLSKVETVIIATWENTHYQLAKKCLLAGKNVFVEKPMSFSFREAEELVKIAKKKKLILMVDSTFLFDESFMLIKKELEKRAIGQLLKIDSFRFSPNIIKPFTNIIADLLPHDLAIFFELTKKTPEIKKVFTQRLRNKEADNSEITLKFGKVITNSYFSWINPLGRREMFFYGSKGVICWQKKDSQNDLLTFFKYRQDKTILIKELIIKDKNKTLKTALEEFLKSLELGRDPKTSGEKVLPEIKILEKVLKKA
jgi:UDP-2-acetamido-3-amino-2,3-dideoxy-glucuronate N-acetyltransferase